MRHVAAYALLVLGGNANPSTDDDAKVLKEAGAQADDKKIAELITACKGKPFHEVVATGLAVVGAFVFVAGEKALYLRL